jgi:hypothetical protein
MRAFYDFSLINQGITTFFVRIWDVLEIFFRVLGHVLIVTTDYIGEYERSQGGSLLSLRSVRWQCEYTRCNSGYICSVVGDPGVAPSDYDRGKDVFGTRQ